MLEHTAMYFNVSPLCEDDSSPFPDFYTRLGPCELQDPVWAKMSALAAGVKKRKKSETKPQAQINKCNNEKRRREQENIYIEELAELISANFADMSSLSVKPDKCAILQETVNQIRSIKQRDGGSQSSDPVQQGEVSSSRPAILSTDVYGPLLLEALEGFLFVVNAEGKVEHVTKNVCNYIKYTEDEILGKSIYNFMHHGDHNCFSSFLLPMSIGFTSEPANKSRSFTCRFMIKSPDNQEESMEEKQQRVTRYEHMHISSTLLNQGADNDDETGDSGPCLLCVASRMTYRDRAAIATVDSFTTKLDTTGKIVGVDTSGVSSYSQFLNKDLMGRALQELCAQQDLHKLNQHLRDTLSAGQAASVVYRLRLGQEKFLHVQTKSKLFKSNPHSNETDFIMATHSIMGENDSSRPSDPGGGNSSSVGGPLMTSVVNGTRNGPPISTASSENSTSMNNTLLTTSSTMYTSLSLENDFILEGITSTWEIPSWPEARPDSRQSVTPVSTPTPRPPSAPTYSPGMVVAQSPITQFVTQPSPSVPNPSTPANPYNSSPFSFSPAADPTFPMEEHKDTKANVLEEPSTMMADSARLRNLLTNPPNPPVVDSANDSDNKNRNRILKTLLNQADEDDNVTETKNSPRGSLTSSRNSIPGPSELPKANTSGGNNMLLQLLNEKSDDDDREARAGIRNQSELLQQLLKEDEQKSEAQSQDDSLLRSLGFTNSPSPPNGEGRGRKRPSDDRDDGASKRSSDGVSSSGTTGSKLCEKNKMLASLLAKQPNNHQPIPPVPNSVITATPQEKLPRIIPDPNLNKTLPNNRMIQQNIQQPNVLTNSRTTRMPGRPSNTSYLNQMLTPGEGIIQRTQSRQFNQVDANSFSSPATSSTDSGLWDMHTSDPLLSDILDQVIDIVPDAIMTDGTDILTLLEQHQPQNNNSSFHHPLSEKMAINIIQKSLMLCESAVNSPSSPTITLPATPPAYQSVVMTTQTSQSGFPPPPNYPRGYNIQRAVRPGTGKPQYASGVTSNQQLVLQKKLIQQQQRERDKRRLLQQQQQQHLLIPSNAVEIISPGLQNMDSLMNNTVAPNVSLQRSSSVPESQLSPNYGGQISQQNQRLNNQQPYSPHSQLTSPLGQQSGFTQTPVTNYQQHGGSRLSPHPPFTQQLSPRQAYPQATTQSTANWQQSQVRLSVQQQQNPMLNAQLTGNYVSGPNSRSFPVQRAPQQQQQQQRAIGSPGTAATRHSPFPADSFAPPGSPNSTTFNQNQYLRLQRANSAPTATTQLPGGLGSPRPYGRDHPPHSYPIPSPHHSMMYQQDSQYCYDQTGLQLPYNGADRGRVPPHLQAGVTCSGTTSEYVRQELRNVVGARSGQTQPANNRSQNTLHQAVNSDLELGGLTYEMPTSGASESPKLWGAMGSDMGSMSPQPATSRTTMEEARQGDHSSRSSLLQKLLSE